MHWGLLRTWTYSGALRGLLSPGVHTADFLATGALFGVTQACAVRRPMNRSFS